MERAGKTHLLTAVLSVATLLSFLTNHSLGPWLSAVAVANLPLVLVLSCLPNRAWSRGLTVLGVLSVTLTLGLLALLLLAGRESSALLSPLLMFFGLWLLPLVWAGWGYVWFFDDFWPSRNQLEKLKESASDPDRQGRQSRQGRRS